jgi:quercetin dioxygenase-like cupin family protein
MRSPIVRPEIGRSRPTPAGFFQGDVRSANLTAGETEVELMSVWFSAGSRTNIHKHPTEQVLIVTEGEIAIAIGTHRYLLQPQEMTVVPKDVWHWHGATPHGPGAHLSIKPRPDPGDWNNAPAADQSEYDAYDDWDTWLEGLTSNDRARR